MPTFTEKLERIIEGDTSVAESTEAIHDVEVPMIAVSSYEDELLSSEIYSLGYRIETHRMIPNDGSDPFEVTHVINEKGGYVGNVERAQFLIKEKGIAPELSELDNNTCSIGFCEQEQKWYGWSHRAICGFGIGDIAKEGDCAPQSGWIDSYLAKYPEKDHRAPVGFKAETLQDAKRIAIAFADSVG